MFPFSTHDTARTPKCARIASQLGHGLEHDNGLPDRVARPFTNTHARLIDFTEVAAFISA